MSENSQTPTPRRPTIQPNSSRIIGFDVARSVAMLGMMVVHFSLVAATDRTQPAWMVGVLALLDGRASATFVILAGIGVTLMSQRAVASGDQQAISAVRRSLVLRGVFLLVVGFINLIIWTGDILRIYGVSLIVASYVLTWPNRRLLVLATAFVVVFACLMLVANFEQNWEWETLTYRNLWTPAGSVRNLFFDGFRSVFPWTGLVLFGMWLGRLDLTDLRVNRRVLTMGIAIAVTAELVSKVLIAVVFRLNLTQGDPATIKFLFGTESMPALPLFLFAASGTATAVIALCVWLTTRYPGFLWTPLVDTGQLALTWYFGHIVIGLGTLLALGVVNTETLPVAAALGVLFFVFAAVVSLGWKKVSRHGPLEWLMRKVAG